MGDTPPLDDLEPDEVSPEPPRDEAPESSEPEPVPPQPEPELPPDPTSGCSIVDFCRADERLDTTAEELCRQLGSSLDEAIAECRAEVPLASVCGPNSQPPYTIITLAGDELARARATSVCVAHAAGAARRLRTRP